MGHATLRASWGAEESGVKRCRLRLQPTPLVIPECVAVAVEADALLVVRQRVDLLQ